MQTVTPLRFEPSSLVTVKALAARYGLSKSTLYELIKSDPTFPFKNIGVRKKFMIDAAKFELWIETRTEQQKESNLGLSTATSLLERFKK